MKLAMTLKFSPTSGVDMDLVREAERLGYDAVWSGEAYGTDAVTPVAWVLAQTEKIKAGTSIMQMPARTPTCAAMTAMTLQAMSGNRFLCGIGPSGPQVVEGWHGVPFGKPLLRTREYIAIIRRILERGAPLEFHGEHYQIPYSGPGATGLGKPLRSIIHGDPTGRAEDRGQGSGRHIADLHVAREAANDHRADPGGDGKGGWGQDPRRFRFGALCPHQHGRGSRGLPRCGPAAPGALYRRDGRTVEELLQRLDQALRLRGGRRRNPGSLPRWPAQGGRGGGTRRVDRRDFARRNPGANPRSSASLEGAREGPSDRHAGVDRCHLRGVARRRRSGHVEAVR